jgi:hypothetical protein
VDFRLYDPRYALARSRDPRTAAQLCAHTRVGSQCACGISWELCPDAREARFHASHWIPDWTPDAWIPDDPPADQPPA